MQEYTNWYLYGKNGAEEREGVRACARPRDLLTARWSSILPLIRARIRMTALAAVPAPMLLVVILRRLRRSLGRLTPDSRLSFWSVRRDVGMLGWPDMLRIAIHRSSPLGAIDA